MNLIRRTPGKTCDNLLPLALLLTLGTFVTEWRWYLHYIRTGEES